MPGDRDLLRRVDSGREWNSQKATRKPWRRSNPTVRKYYRLEGEEDVDPWEGNILEQPPGALPRSLRTSASAWTLSSPTPSEFSTRPTSPISPLQGQRSDVFFPGTAPAIGGGATAVPLSKPPPLQLGDLHARMSSRRTLGVEAPLSTSARRQHGVRNQSMLEAMKGLDREEAEDETPAQEDDTEEESRRTEANAPLWTTRIAAEDDPFETTLKLAGIEKMKRRELRRMKELSADALARLTGFRQSDLRMLGGEDASPLERFQQEAEAKYGLQSSHYRDLLTSYRHKAYEAQMGARRETLKPLLPVRKRFFKTPSKLKDELAYLETLTDGDDVASDFLFVRRAKASVRSYMYGKYLHDGCRFQLS